MANLRYKTVAMVRFYRVLESHTLGSGPATEGYDFLPTA